MRVHFDVKGRSNILSLDVHEDSSLDELMAQLEVATSIAVSDQTLSVDGRSVPTSDPHSRVDTHGIKDGVVVSVSSRAQGSGAGAGAGAGAGGASAAGGAGLPAGGLAGLSPNLSLEQFAQTVRGNPQLLSELRAMNPAMADAVMDPDPARLSAMVRQSQGQRSRANQEMAELERRLAADPWNPDLQKRLEEMIRLKNVDKNLEHAMEHNPESFGSVVMLYVDAVVNETPVKAFVDSGAQSTIMSVSCAERCGIMRLIDTRYAGIAKGVGQAKILGRVHMAPIKIGSSFFYSSFTVLEGDSMDFLLGLDFLSKHQCMIDLRSTPRCLRIGDEAVPFLQETDLPEHARGTRTADTGDGGGFGEPLAGAGLLAGAGGPSSSSSSTAATTGQGQGQGHSASGGSGAAGDPLRGHSREKVEMLQSLGSFSLPEILMALDSCNGNAELAASLLLGGL